MTAALRRPLALAAGCWAAFAVVLAAAYWLPLARWADGWAVDGFLGLQRPWLNDAAARFVHIGDPLPFALMLTSLGLVALYRGRPRHALAVIALGAGANLTAQYLQVMLEHPRTHDFLGGAQLGAASFPSGHATASMSIALAAILVAPAAWRPLVAIGGGLFALAISESILLLAWHFPSDVIGGYLVAASYACVVVAALGAAQARWPERTGREAAKRAIGRASATWAAGLVIAASAIAGVVIVAAVGGRVFAFADHHTTVLAAVLGVAAMAAAVPTAIAALSLRRP